MAYLMPSEFVAKMVDAGEAKVFMSTRDTVIRAYMAGALLALAAVFAVTVTVQTGYPIIGAILFPVGFCMLYLLGFDLLTGVFVLAPLALIDRRPGVTIGGVLRNWGLVFVGNFLGALTVAYLMAIVFTFGFSTPPDKVGSVIAGIGEARTLGYAKYGAAGMLTLFIRGMLCNWMVSTGVVGAMISTSVSGKVIAMWMPIMLFFGSNCSLPPPRRSAKRGIVGERYVRLNRAASMVSAVSMANASGSNSSPIHSTCSACSGCAGSARTAMRCW
jgi:formate/nitrite transporter FocA (FNT family)